jgi:hypothetical protein
MYDHPDCPDGALIVASEIAGIREDYPIPGRNTRLRVVDTLQQGQSLLMLAAEREERSVVPQNIDVARADGDRGFDGAKGVSMSPASIAGSLRSGGLRTRRPAARASATSRCPAGEFLVR